MTSSVQSINHDQNDHELSPHNRNNSLSALVSTLSASSSVSGEMSKQWIPEETEMMINAMNNSDTNNSIIKNGTVSSSTSTSTSNVTTPHHSTTRFKHYHKPTISDSPTLVSLCQTYIDEENIDGLARIARNKGLPPELRQYAWPLLLATHPYALSPSVIAEYPNSQSSLEELVPIKRIRGDISRYRKRLKQQKEAVARHKTKHSAQSSTSSTQISSQTSTYASTNTSVPTSPTNTHATNPFDSNSDTVNAFLSESIENERYQIIEMSIERFLTKWGATIPYESGMIWTAFGLADWVDPVYILDTRKRRKPHNHKSNSNNDSADTTPSSPSSTTSSSVSGSSTPELAPIGVWEEETLQHSFADVFEQLMLVMFHSPPLGSDGPSGPCDSPLSQRLSTFLSIFRKLLPELSDYFDEEDVLSSIGGDEWLLWWVKWMGAKVWNACDRGRVWDMYLGWRYTNNQEPNSYDLGVDPFWSPIELESDLILAPHVQHLFVCFAMLKSKSNTLFELDQSEIRQFLTQVSKCNDMESIVLEAGEAWRSWQWAEESEENDE